MPIKTNVNQLNWIKEIWTMLSFKLKIPGSKANSIFEEIKERHSEPHRAYHNLSHLYHLFMLLENHPDDVQQIELIELAILFHDIIYEPGQSDNEIKSADKAEELIGKYISAVDMYKLRLIIESTKLHKPKLAGSDNQYFLDMDLAILGVDAKYYDVFSRKIKKEFSSIIPEKIFNEGRKHFLLEFLKRKNIYFTEMYSEEFEEVARENLKREILNLTQSN